MDTIKESKDLCRLCANHDDQMMPIFTGDGLEHNLATKIERYLPITILENDKLPLLVCYQCASTLISWHNLYEGFLLADRKLKEICYDNKDVNSQEHKAQRRVSEEICIVTYDSEPDDNTEVIEVNESGFLEINENAKEQGSDQYSNERCSTEYASNGMTLPKASVGDDNCADRSALEIKDPSQCTVCFKKLSSARSRNRHMRTQHNVDISLSKECSVVVVLNENNLGPEENAIKQESTSEITTRPKRNLKRNVALINWKIPDEEIEENFTCHECEKRFKYKCALREHVKMHLKMFRCNYCTKLFSTEQLKELHSQRRHNERHKGNIDVKIEHLICSICDKQFMRKSNFTRHLLNHREAGSSSKSNVICAICNKIFGSSSSLKRHILVVHEKEDRETHLKQLERNQKYEFLEKYVKIIDNEKYLQCDQCRFISKKNEKWKFAEHYRIHTGERPFTCDICNKTFRTKRSLRCHTMFVHEGIKKFPCDICGRCFSDKRYTADHRRTHTGERPYVCDLCGKMFKQAASLFVHKEGHEGRKDHECELCGNKFTRRSHLNVHLRRHRGERNHMCSTCGKAFIDSNQLKNHYSVHSQERPHKCELCGDAFKLKKHLKQHFKVHYKPLPPNTISLSQLNVETSLLNPKMTSEDE